MNRKTKKVKTKKSGRPARAGWKVGKIKVERFSDGIGIRIY